MDNAAKTSFSLCRSFQMTTLKKLDWCYCGISKNPSQTLLEVGLQTFPFSSRICVFDFSCFSFLQVMVIVASLFEFTCFLNIGDWCSRSNFTFIQNFVLLAPLCRTGLLCCYSCLSCHIEGSCTYYMCYQKYINQEKLKTSCSWHGWLQFLFFICFRFPKERHQSRLLIKKM